MTKGRRPLMALREAVVIAKKRGETRQFMHEPGTICNFVIYCLGFIAHVRIKRVTRVHCSHEWIEWEAADAIAMLRAIASGSGISRELFSLPAPREVPVFPGHGHRTHRARPRWLGDAGKDPAGFHRAAVHNRVGSPAPGPGTHGGNLRRRKPLRKGSGRVRIDPS